MGKWAIVLGVILFAFTVEAQTARYFSSPKDAVLTINDLLTKNDWAALTAYYDLSTPLKTEDGTEITAEFLQSGKYFFCFDCPPSSSPVNDRFRNPFPPGLKFQNNRTSSEPSVIIVTVGREIDLGDDNKQKVSQDIYLRRTDRGYQLLPTEYAYYTPGSENEEQQ